MTIRSYEIFAAVCDAQSMSAAASKLFISQSAVSQCIRELEANYNVKLFERGAHKLVLTMHGEELLRFARHMISYSEHIETSMRSLGVRQKIRLGTVMPLFACELMSKYKSISNQVEMTIHTLKFEELFSLMTSSGLDAAIVDSKVEREGLEYLPLAQEDVGFICKKNTGLHSGLANGMSSISIYEFEKLPIIYTDRCQELHEKFKNELKWRGIGSNIALTFSSSLEAHYAVELDLGVAMTSRNASRAHLKNCQFFTVSEFNYKRVLYFAYPKEKTLQPKFTRFLEFVKTETPSMMRGLNVSFSTLNC